MNYPIKIFTKTLPHSELKVHRSDGCRLQLFENHFEYREYSEVEMLEDGLWNEYIWNNDMIILKSDLSVIEHYWNNDFQFWRIEIVSRTRTLRLDYKDKEKLLEDFAILKTWFLCKEQ